MNLFDRIDEESYPESAAGVVARLIDGLGYRFRHVTADLPDACLNVDPGGGHMTIAALMEHIANLIRGVASAVGANTMEGSDRDAILAGAKALRDRLMIMEDAALMGCTMRNKPVWCIVSGPISDALTHIGQVASLRRLQGYPAPAYDIFGGSGPRV